MWEMQKAIEVKQSLIEENRVVGKHIYANLYGCDVNVISDEKKLSDIVKEAAKLAKAVLYELKVWKFGGDKGGVSVIGLVLESHIAIHTWPKYEYATVDVYTCGAHTDPWSAFKYIVSQLKPKNMSVNYADRSSPVIT